MKNKDKKNKVLGEQELITSEEKVVLPVIEESLIVDVETIETGKVHVHKKVKTDNVTLDVLLTSSEVEITRTPKDEELQQPLSPRREGDVTIIPVMKEVAVVVKKLMLVEEIRIEQKKKETTEKIDAVLRSEHIEVERTDAA